MRATLSNGVHVQDESITKASRETTCPSAALTSPLGSPLLLSRKSNVISRADALHANVLPSNSSVYGPELILRNLELSECKAVAHCPACDKEMAREPITTWQKEGHYGIGKSQTLLVHVPLTVLSHSWPTPDLVWHVFDEMCSACARPEAQAVGSQCRRCRALCETTFCKDCEAQRPDPVAPTEQSANCVFCSRLWSRCVCVPYLYEPKKVYF